MSRLERAYEKSTNPTTKFLEWKSNEKCFSFYDKEKTSNVEVKLPIRLGFIEHYHTVKGWHDKSESNIYSNEVFSLGIEPLEVKSFKGGKIATGLYSAIRNEIKDNGARYHRSVYAVLDEELVNFSFKGSVVAAYSEFAKTNSNKFEQNWIEINSFEELKKGATKYSVPIFTIGKPFTKIEDDLIVEKAKILQEHMNIYFGKTTKQQAESESIDDFDEDLGF